MQLVFRKSHAVTVAVGPEGRWVWWGMTGLGFPFQYCSLAPTIFPGIHSAVPGV